MCQSKPSQTGKKLSVSYSCCTILEFLTDPEKVRMQLLCKKWRNLFVPMTLKSCPASFTIKPTKSYQIVFDCPDTGIRYYLGTKMDL